MTSLVYNRNLSSDLVWNSNTNQYGLAHGPVGDNLYAYTDPNPSGRITYYAWYYEEAGYYWYTLSSAPSSGDNVYQYDNTTGTMSLNEYCGVDSYNPNTNELTVGTLGDKELCQRDSEADVIINETLYAWTVDPEDIKNLVIEFPFHYIKDGQYLTLPDNTIYTKTPVVDTSTNVYYLVDNTELAITNIHFSSTDPFDSNGIISADENSITIDFEN